MKKKIKFILTVLIVTISGSINSQISFYVKPTVEHKSTIGRPVASIRGTKKASYLDNPYVKHENYNFYPNFNFQIGLSAGLKLNEKHFFEFVYSQDIAGVGSRLGYFTYLNPENNIQQHIITTGSSFYAIYNNRFSLNYHYQFFSTKNEIVSFRINLGLGLFFNRLVKQDNVFLEKTWYWDADENNYISETAFLGLEEYNMYSLKRLSGLGQIGLGIDFKSKKHHLFSFDVTYTQGFQNVLSKMSRYVIFDSGVQKEYYYYTTTKGSGLTLQISRKFQLYPWRPNKKVKDGNGL